MIYSIGYARMTQADLFNLTRALGLDAVIDVRAKPVSRKPGFGGRQLASLLGARYQWAGDTLGGLGARATSEGLSLLRRSEEKGRTIALLCLEEAPGDCHRHGAIATALLPDIEVRHIYMPERAIIDASELERSLRDGNDYQCEEFEL